AMTRLIGEGGTVSGRQFAGAACRAYTTSSSLVFCEDGEDDGPRSIMVCGDGEYEVCGTRFSVTTLPWSEIMNPKQPAGVLIADASKLDYPFEAREWREGDWLVPLGMRGRKKLSDLFVDLKFSLEDKRRAVVLQREGEEKSAALVGQRIDDSLKVGPSTRSVIRISLLK
nr:tRNA lysidine(34) synthetase TilS [Bacteroidales bacterium]